MSGPAPQPYAGLERWLDEHYARVGSRYLGELLLAMVAWILSIYVLAMGGLAFYFDASVAEYLTLLGCAELLAVAIVPLGVFVWSRRARPLIEWVRGERSAARAPEAWRHATEAPLRMPATVFMIALPVMILWSYVATVVLDTGIESFPSVALAAILLNGPAILGVALFAGQLTVRPLLRDVGRYLPEAFAFDRSRVGLAQQLLIRLVLIGLTMTLVGGAVGAISDDELLRFTLGFTLAPVVLILLGAVMFPAAALSLVGPVNELIDATRRAGEGDLTAQVPVLTSDELGELSHSFNRMVADLRRTTEELRESRARIVAASDSARRGVERDLHDGAQQYLVLLNLQLGLIERGVQGDAAGEAAVAEAKETLARALGELRDLAHGIYPAILESEGLPGALADAARRAAIRTTVEADGTGRLPAEIEAAVYFCCLEALQNAAKHAGTGAHATVRLAARNGALEFEVADDGPGFDAGAAASRGGLQNMADRIGALGGTLTVDSAPGAGTAVRGRVPVS